MRIITAPLLGFCVPVSYTGFVSGGVVSTFVPTDSESLMVLSPLGEHNFPRAIKEESYQLVPQ